ncbi:MAG: hypothetical protein EXR69_13255 [Myxococcales bacterium]|nr:hypothetical protein [Myxococcales bacterium]
MSPGLLPGLVVAGVAAVLAWLSVVDRMSPLAMYVVELEGALGVALWIPVVGIAAGLLARVRWARPARNVERRETQESQRQRGAAGWSPRASIAPAPEQGADAINWRAVIDTRALRLPVGPQGRVRIDEVPDVPYTLVLTGVTPQQARNRLALFAELLSGMPTPPLARVRLESSPDVGGPIHKLLGAELARFFAPESFHVVSREDGADIRFSLPDPRWPDPRWPA